jgi:hypothetical protein
MLLPAAAFRPVVMPRVVGRFMLLPAAAFRPVVMPRVIGRFMIVPAAALRPVPFARRMVVVVAARLGPVAEGLFVVHVVPPEFCCLCT